jgi:NTP pyrophosphatase (non-canonical NTP hydrolase)
MSVAEREGIKAELGDVLWTLTACCHELGLTLEEIAEMNIQKLTDRKARGVIHGNGDNR